MSSSSRRIASLPSSTSSSIFSHFTWSFVASWRGQLLVCVALTFIGALYFFIRDPIDDWHRRRREVLSRRREEELISMERDKEPELDDESKEGKMNARERGREKRKEVKKRKGSLLKVPNGTEPSGPSSIESSPAPIKITTPSSSLSFNSKSRPIPIPASPQRQASSSIRTRKPMDEAIHTPNRQPPPPPIVLPQHTASSTSISPWNIPLPESPEAGPSRSCLSISAEDYYGSDDGSEYAQSSQAASKSSTKLKSEGFSIMPDDGYLPRQSAPSSKKKKKKGKPGAGAGGGSQALSAGESGADTSRFSHTNESASIPIDSILVNGAQKDHRSNGHEPNRPVGMTSGRSRHNRISSIATKPDLDIEELRNLVEQRDETIDALRAEIGVAKAEEAKAREDAGRSKLNEEKMRSDLDRAKRQTRSREAEMQSRFSQLHTSYTQVAQRLAAFENVLREHGASVPSLPSPLPMQLPPSPMPPMPVSPYAPSPVRHTPIGAGNGGAFIPYPSPGMYPSPMLHPGSYHAHSQSPSPFRRVSAPGPGPMPGQIPITLAQNGHLPSQGGEDASLAGPLTPGQGGMYQMDISSSTMPIGAPNHPSVPIPNGSGAVPIPNSMSAARRQSIESSVLKKKINGVNGNGAEAIREEDKDNGTDSNGSHRPSRSASPSSSRGAGGIALGMLSDGDRGNIYFATGIARGDGGGEGRKRELSSQGSDAGESASASLSDSQSNNQDLEIGDGDGGIILEPMFASLAHTPEQVEEMRKKQVNEMLRMKRQRGRSTSTTTHTTNSNSNPNHDLISTRGGVGVGGLLTPSPSKSPVPLRTEG